MSFFLEPERETETGEVERGNDESHAVTEWEVRPEQARPVPRRYTGSCPRPRAVTGQLVITRSPRTPYTRSLRCTTMHT